MNSMKNPNRLPGGALKIKYEVHFEVSEGCLREDKRVTVDVNDTGNEFTNKADAIVAASLELDNQGIKHWSLKGTAKVTS